MTAKFRVIDTGLRDGRANIAFDAAMIELRANDKIPDTMRFLQFPPTALIGRHQALNQEIDVEFCNTHGIGIARRLTGGGAIYFDEQQLGWSLVFKRNSLGISSLQELTRAICEAAAAGLSTLGVDAHYRPRNDIEVAGRKISGTGGFFDGDTLFYQGTVLIDLNLDTMISALRVPAAKLEKRQLDSVANRVVTLRELLGTLAPDIAAVKEALVDAFCRELNLTAYYATVTNIEELKSAEIFADEVGQEAFVTEIDAPPENAMVAVGSHQCRGGNIVCYLRLEGQTQNRIREALFTGDFFVTPPRLLYDLEANLRGIEIVEAPDQLRNFFSSAAVDMLSVSPDDFLAALRIAIQQSRLVQGT